jgi:hypothetical protein
MSDMLGLPMGFRLRAGDAGPLNSVLSRFAEARPISDALALRIRATDRNWSTTEVDLMSVGEATLAYEWLVLPPDLPQGLRLPGDRLASLPRAVRPLMSAMMLTRAARSWPGPQPAHAGLRQASSLEGHLRMILEFFSSGNPVGSILIGIERSEAVALADAGGLSAATTLDADPALIVDVLPRIAAVTVTAAEAEALAPGDVVLLGPLEAPFDAIRIGPETRNIRKTEDGGLILDTTP